MQELDQTSAVVLVAEQLSASLVRRAVLAALSYSSEEVKASRLTALFLPAKSPCTSD